MEIERIVSKMLLSNMYVIRENGHMILIDPCVTELDISDTSLDYILLSHEHYDHISGVNHFKKFDPVKVVCSQMCAERIRDPKKNMAHHYLVFCSLQTWTQDIPEPEQVDDTYSCSADIVYEDRYAIQWCGHDIRFVSTPGHSPGSSAILIDDAIMFSGDSLIKGYAPTLRFPGGSKKQWQSISEPFYKSLDEGMRVYPGHFDEFTMSEYRWDT